VASTITLDAGQKGRGVAGDKFIRRGSGNLGIYATNGVAVTTGQFELASEISDLDLGIASGIVFEFDKTNMKIKAYRQKDPAAAGGADISLPEVTNAVDLSAVTFRFRAEGI
jgi:hypothetical protein